MEKDLYLLSTVSNALSVLDTLSLYKSFSLAYLPEEKRKAMITDYTYKNTPTIPS